MTPWTPHEDDDSDHEPRRGGWRVTLIASLVAGYCALIWIALWWGAKNAWALLNP